MSFFDKLVIKIYLEFLLIFIVQIACIIFIFLQQLLIIIVNIEFGVSKLRLYFLQFLNFYFLLINMQNLVLLPYFLLLLKSNHNFQLILIWQQLKINCIITSRIIYSLYKLYNFIFCSVNVTCI
jgi:hypothetical protein